MRPLLFWLMCRELKEELQHYTSELLRLKKKSRDVTYNKKSKTIEWKAPLLHPKPMGELFGTQCVCVWGC